MPEGVVEARWLDIVDGRIENISPSPLVPVDGCTLVDASDQIIGPGLVNAHIHSPLSATKGSTDKMDHPVFMWTNQRDTVSRSEQQIEAATVVAAADLLRNGITSVIDYVPEQNATAERHSRVRRPYCTCLATQRYANLHRLAGI